MCPTYTYRCIWKDCEVSFEEYSSIAERDETRVCPACGKKAKRAWSGHGVAPMPMFASMADGHVPAQRAGAFRDEAEATRLQIESYDKPHEERGEIKKEIRKLREAKK